MSLPKACARRSRYIAAAFFAGILSPANAFALPYPGQEENTVSAIARNVTESIQDLPGLVSGIAYLIGITLGILGIFRVREHISSPAENSLKDGAASLFSGGALFALPIVFEAMRATVGTDAEDVSAPLLKPVTMGLKTYSLYD